MKKDLSKFPSVFYPAAHDLRTISALLWSEGRQISSYLVTGQQSTENNKILFMTTAQKNITLIGTTLRNITFVKCTTSI